MKTNPRQMADNPVDYAWAMQGCHLNHKNTGCPKMDVSWQHMCTQEQKLAHRGRVTHICASKITITGSDNGLSPCRNQAIILTNAWILLIGPWRTNLNEMLIKMQQFSFKKMRLKMPSRNGGHFVSALKMARHMHISLLKNWYADWAHNSHPYHITCP